MQAAASRTRLVAVGSLLILIATLLGQQTGGELLRLLSRQASTRRHRLYHAARFILRTNQDVGKEEAAGRQLRQKKKKKTRGKKKKKRKMMLICRMSMTNLLDKTTSLAFNRNRMRRVIRPARILKSVTAKDGTGVTPPTRPHPTTRPVAGPTSGGRATMKGLVEDHSQYDTVEVTLP